uniref:Tudor domain-containing protein n=1 Tax=Syphacia muris TaxID=451379 RepID=A0A0N5AP57_9BILA
MYEESIQKTYVRKKTFLPGWCVGDLCLAPYYEEDLWYPAVIKEISYLNKTCTVLYDEYNETSTVQISDLEPYVINIFYFAFQSAWNMPKLVPPPPPMFSNIPMPSGEESVSNMLLSWYMCGYHTGYYQVIKF